MIAPVIPCICQGLFVSEDTYSCQEPAHHLERSGFLKSENENPIATTGLPEGQLEKKEQLAIHMARVFKKRDSASAATVDKTPKCALNRK